MTGSVSVRSGVGEDCIISFLIPTVHISRAENWFVKRGMLFTADELKNPPFLPLGKLTPLASVTFPLLSVPLPLTQRLTL